MIDASWQKEINQLDSEISLLASSRSKSQKRVLRSIQVLKNKIHQEQLQITRLVDRIGSNNKRQRPISAAEQSILYWAKVISGIAEKALHASIEKTGTKIWLMHLLQQLRGQFHPMSLIPDRHQVLELGARFASLQRAETGYENEIDSLQKQKKDLHKQYLALEIELVNKQAMNSWQVRLGKTVHAALNNHAWQAIQIFAMHNFKGKVKDLAWEFEEYADATLKKCEDHILTRAAATAKDTKRLKDEVEVLTQMQSQLQGFDINIDRNFMNPKMSEIPSLHPSVVT